MAKKRKQTVQEVVSEDATKPASDSRKVEVAVGEAAEVTGTAEVRVVAGTAWVAGKLLLQGSVTNLSSDAKFGGAIHIEARSDQEEVPLVISTPVTLKVSEASHGDPETESPGYSLQVLSAQQMHNKHYPDSWLQAAEAVVQAAKQEACPRVAVAGSKGTGKSTLARLLVNSLLNVTPVVAFLDTDCGQAELTVPGVVSLTLLEAPLFGPPHVHLQPPTRAHFIGDLSPHSNPAHYITAVQSLHDWYLNQSAKHSNKGRTRPPLVINTHGWIKGLGIEVLAQILDSTSPSHVMQLHTDNPNNDLPSDAWWQADPGGSYAHSLLYHLPSASLCQQEVTLGSPGWVPRQPPAEQRALQWLAFAKQCLGNSNTCSTWDLPAFATTADALASQPPYRVPLSNFRVVFHHAKLAAPLVPQALNGAVVAFTRAASNDTTNSETALSSAEARPSLCLAIGVVRTVDTTKGLLYILTPAPLEVLKQSTTIEVGKLDLPLALLQSSTFSTPYISTWSITADGTGAGAMKARNTLIRSRLKPLN